MSLFDVCTPRCCCCRLKAELQGLSKPPAGVVSGGSPFDVKLLALTARLSQWTHQERTAGEVGGWFCNQSIN
jgi:hypothetical protein